MVIIANTDRFNMMTTMMINNGDYCQHWWVMLLMITLNLALDDGAAASICSWSICISQVKNWRCLYRLRKKGLNQNPSPTQKAETSMIPGSREEVFSCTSPGYASAVFLVCTLYMFKNLKKDMIKYFWEITYDPCWYLSWQSKWETYCSGNDTCKGDGGSPHVCKTEKGWTQVCL